MAITDINTLPVIITKPGEYLTRNGITVVVHEVHAPASEGTSFAAKGTWWKVSKTGRKMPKYNIWHVSGRLFVLRESPLDIVKQA